MLFCFAVFKVLLRFFNFVLIYLGLCLFQRILLSVQVLVWSSLVLHLCWLLWLGLACENASLSKNAILSNDIIFYTATARIRMMSKYAIIFMAALQENFFNVQAVPNLIKKTNIEDKFSASFFSIVESI